MYNWKVCCFCVLCFCVGCSPTERPEESARDAGSPVERAEEANVDTRQEQSVSDAGREALPEPSPEPTPEPAFEKDPPKEVKPIPKYPQDGLQAIVVHVTDGDTLYVVMKPGGWASRIRLKGVNAPECYKKTVSGSSFQSCTSDKEYYGLQSYRSLKDILSGASRRVTISCIMKGDRCETDDFDRSLAFLKTPDGKDVGETSLRKGAVLTFTRYSHNKMKAYCQAEADSIRAKAGMWSKGRSYVKSKMSNTVRNWYYNYKPNHDSICSKAMGRSFSKAAGE